MLQNYMSKHARIRSQQRGISPILIDLLLEFGANEPAGDGASKVFFNKAARRRLKVYAGPLTELLSEHLDVYAIASSDGQIITMAHRTERIRRH